MTIVFKDRLELEESFFEGAAVRARFVQARRFLCDANIADVYRTLQASVSASILLLQPAQTHMVAMAADQDANGQIAEMNFEQRNVVLLPVNDATLRVGNEGQHWSLLAFLRTADGNNSTCFSPFLFDSAQLPSHQARAAVLVRKFLGASAQLQVGECALQNNGFDSGIYLSLFSEIIAKGYG